MTNKTPDSQNNNGNSPFSNRNAQRIWIVAAIVVALLFVVIFAQPNNIPRGNKITLDRLAEEIRDGSVVEIQVRGGNDVYIELTNNTNAYYYKERETNLLQALQNFGVTQEQMNNVRYYEQQGDNTTNLLF